MSAEGSAQAAVPAEEVPKASEATTSSSTTAPASSEPAAPAGEKVNDVAPVEQSAAAAPKEELAKSAQEPTKSPADKPAPEADVVVKAVDEAPAAPPTEEATSKPEGEQTAEAGASAERDAAVTTSTTPAKTVARRKSTGPVGGKGKTLSKKASKARILHLDAKPGEHYFIKLKGYPPWPGIICDEEMLPLSLIKSRPVTAARADGTYREDYADGGKRAADRTFPVMYLSTNEFGWVANADLVDLDPEKVLELINSKMRKDLVDAHQLASQQNSLDHYKNLLQQFAEDLAAKQQAKEAKAATPAKKSKKSKTTDADGDIEMADADEEPAKEKKSKKRKADDEAATPQRSDSVKKPKIKLTNNATPKGANGVSTPKSGKAKDDTKPAKSKSKKTEEKKSEPQVPKEPELSPEEKHQRKEKEVLFLRHKLQKGLLARDQEPKEEEMKMMSEYITKLEGLPDLEVSIIRNTKINKVLKAILKLENIPKEDEFQFKPRSNVLLEKWNKILAVDGAPGAAAPANGVNGTSAKPTEKKDEPKATNGVKENGEADTSKVEQKTEEKLTPAEAPKEQPAVEKPAAVEPAKAPEAAEATAAA